MHARAWASAGGTTTTVRSSWRLVFSRMNRDRRVALLLLLPASAFIAWGFFGIGESYNDPGMPISNLSYLSNHPELSANVHIVYNAPKDDGALTAEVQIVLPAKAPRNYQWSLTGYGFQTFQIAGKDFDKGEDQSNHCIVANAGAGSMLRGDLHTAKIAGGSRSYELHSTSQGQFLAVPVLFPSNSRKEHFEGYTLFLGPQGKDRNQHCAGQPPLSTGRDRTTVSLRLTKGLEINRSDPPPSLNSDGYATWKGSDNGPIVTVDDQQAKRMHQLGQLAGGTLAAIALGTLLVGSAPEK